MNICFISSTFLPSIGGSQIGLHTIANELKDRGNNVFIIVPFYTFLKLKKKKWKINYTVFPLPPKIIRLYYHYPRIGSFFLKHYLSILNIFINADIWIANLAYPSGTILGNLSKYSKFKKNAVLCPGDDIQISEDINYGLRLNSKINNEIKKNFIKLNNFIALTKSVKIEYDKLGIPNEKIIEIPYGVKKNNLFTITDKKTLRHKYNIDNDTFIFLCVGRNHPKKNYKLFIKIVNHLNKYNSLNYKILIVGKELDSLDIKIKKSNLGNYFSLVDEVSNIPNENLNFPSTHLKELYRLSDCFLFPSSLETFGIVLVEAMMAQLPIITTNAPGCRDVIRKDIDGLVFKVDDYKKAAEYMKEVILNLNKRKLLIEMSAKRSNTFDVKNIAKLYENLVLKNK